MKGKKNISSGAKWEEIVGYSRAVVVDGRIEIAGTTAIKNGQIVGADDAYLQTKCILELIENVLKSSGSKLSDVVRTRIFVTNISNWEEVGRAHGEMFKDIKPATTMVEVSRLIDEKILVEIEASAIIQSK